VSPAPFEVQVEELDGGVRAFTVRGELDMNTAPELERSLQETTSEQDALVMLDLADCEFIDSTGIALLVRTWQQLDRDADGDGRGHLVVCCVNHQVRRLLTITGLEASISIHEDRGAALAELGS
jgi:anti-anti-sigma factor